jgi:hypothetical protein
MRRGVIQIEVVFLAILAMIALGIRQPKQAFLQDRVSAIPERQ